MKIPVSFGGGGGSGSDDCTATAADVLKSKTAIYSGTDDEPENGSMEDYSGTTKTATPALDSSSSQMTFAIPNTGKYDTAAKLAATYATIRSLIGYTDASKVLAGTTFLGLAGTMTNRSGTTQTATASINGSNIRMQIPNTGYYDTTSYVQASYSNIASLVGLTAAKIKYGETIMGITGTWNGYVATTSDIYYGGATGICGSGTAVSGSSSWTITFDTSCIVISSSASTTNQGGVYFANALNTGAYSKISLTFEVVSTTTSSSYSYMTLALYSSKPSSSINSDVALDVQKPFSEISAGNSYTISIDLSNVSQSLYVGFYLRSNSASIRVNVTRVQVS